MTCEATLTTHYPIRLPDGTVEDNTILVVCVLDHPHLRHDDGAGRVWSGLGPSQHFNSVPAEQPTRFGPGLRVRND